MTQLQWDQCDRPFPMLRRASDWPATRHVPQHDRRVRHLAAAFVWSTIDRFGERLLPGEDMPARTVAGVLDADPPGAPAPWHYLARAWLRHHCPDFRSRPAEPGRRYFADLADAVAALNRSRAWGGLHSVLAWGVIHARPLHRLPDFETRLFADAPYAALVRDVFPRPRAGCREPWAPGFRKEWLTDTATALARLMYTSRDYAAMPILADALQDAGCDDEAMLAHCRDPHQPHCRGCWVLETVLAGQNLPRDPRPPRTPPPRNAHGEALTRCTAVVGRADQFVAAWRDPADPDSESCLYVTAAQLDARFPGWRAFADAATGHPGVPYEPEKDAPEDDDDDAADDWTDL